MPNKCRLVVLVWGMDYVFVISVLSWKDLDLQMIYGVLKPHQGQNYLGKIFKHRFRTVPEL